MATVEEKTAILADDATKYARAVVIGTLDSGGEFVPASDTNAFNLGAGSDPAVAGTVNDATATVTAILKQIEKDLVSDAAVNTYSSMTALGYQQITSLSSATALTVPNGATKAVIKCETQAVRWRDDGTNPTSTVGMPMATTDAPFEYTGSLSAIKFIEQSASAKLNVAYYGPTP